MLSTPSVNTSMPAEARIPHSLIHPQLPLIIFSLLSEDVTCLSSWQIAPTTEKEIMRELIMAGFEKSQTAFLSRAALARLQKDLGFSVHDMAIVTREADGSIAVQQVVNLGDRAEKRATVWEILADLLFTPGPSMETISDIELARVGIGGIDRALTSRTAEQFRLCESALLVLVRSLPVREKILGVLHGFHGETARVPLPNEGGQPPLVQVLHEAHAERARVPRKMKQERAGNV